jgi:hypothetical protein
MGYYIRVLGKLDPNIHIDELIAGLNQNGLSANFSKDEDESADNWSVILVSNIAGDELMQIERNPVIEGELGKDELDEFRERVLDFEPRSAAKWLVDYFDKIKVIYAFQLLNASFMNENFSIIDNIKSTIWNKTGGVLQADNEGFSNESGYHILWQFSDDVSGPWNMAILNDHGEWTNFTMELNDKEQREEFWQSKIPTNAIRM